MLRSWILLFGLFPIDFDDLTVVEPGRRFLEVSSMLGQRQWRHERILLPDDEGCVVTDRIRFLPRIGPPGPVYLAVFRLAFPLRNRNLRRRFG